MHQNEPIMMERVQALRQKDMGRDYPRVATGFMLD
jgi:hypothetical protein